MGDREAPGLQLTTPHRAGVTGLRGTPAAQGGTAHCFRPTMGADRLRWAGLRCPQTTAPARAPRPGGRPCGQHGALRRLPGLPYSPFRSDLFAVLVCLSTCFGGSAVLLSGVLGQSRKWRRAGPWHLLPRALSCLLPASSLSPKVARGGWAQHVCQENWGAAPPLGGLALCEGLSRSCTRCFAGVCHQWFRAQAPSPPGPGPSRC